ncbi:DUF7408 domain-containing protein [Ponticaulis profundi]|uniref:DUF7408 domain-containing protein n=1 Tax=Ponticaulis profundi TaxID=2665222 RepID=A0ABW1SAP3_9PROT
MMEASRFGFDPFIPLWAFAALGIACLIVWGFYAFRGGRAWLTRALALCIITAALSNPLLIQENRDPLKSTVALVVDRSASMEVDGREDRASEIAAAIEDQLTGSEYFEVRRVETQADAPETALTTRMISALSDMPRSQIAGTIMITDGQAHDVPDDLEGLEAFGPVQSLIVGREDEQDRRIEITQSPSYGIVGDEALFKVNVEAEASVVRVEVRVNDLPAFYVPVQPGLESEIPVEVDRRGPNTVVFSIPEVSGELTTINNLTAATLTGIRDTLRVLLITGEPHQGGRAWRDLLKSDPMVDLVHFTILRPPHKQDATPTSELALIAFPTVELFEEKLDEFDLIIFDRYKRRNVLHLRYLDNIARYVDRGGALLIAAGKPFAGPQSLHRTPLASVLPLAPSGEVFEEPFKPTLSELGRKHSVTRTLDENTFGQWYRQIEARRVTGDVLMTGENGAPLLALDRVGEGRVAELMSDHLWLWARGHDGGGPFAELIRRLVHWMMKEPELEEERLSLSSDGQTLIARLTTLTPAPEPLTLTAPDGSERELVWQQNDDTVYEIREDVSRLGLYRADSEGLRALHLLGPSQPREYEELRSTTEVLQPLADATDGSVRRVRSASDTPNIRATRNGGAGGDWIGLRDREAYVVRDSETHPILPAWLVAGMLFGLLLLAWRREGK